jgi:hydrogenase maturation protease
VRHIIGVGSPFGADQLGWRAIDLLREAALPDCKLIKLDRPGSQLIRYLEDAQDVVLIDAVQVDQQPGRAIRLERTALSLAACQTSSHGFGVAEALEMAAQLGYLPERLLLIGIQIGADLSIIPELSRDELVSLL